MFDVISSADINVRVFDVISSAEIEVTTSATFRLNSILFHSIVAVCDTLSLVELLNVFWRRVFSPYRTVFTVSFVLFLADVLFAFLCHTVIIFCYSLYWFASVSVLCEVQSFYVSHAVFL